MEAILFSELLSRAQPPNSQQTPTACPRRELGQVAYPGSRSTLQNVLSQLAFFFCLREETHRLVKPSREAWLYIATHGTQLIQNRKQKKSGLQKDSLGVM